MNKTYITESAEKTQEIGAKFARILLAQATQGVSLSGKNVVALYGNLGSGKTTFVQGLARGFGIKKRIISPTFIIVRSYKIDSKYQVLSPSVLSSGSKDIKHFYHIDLFRIEGEEDLKGLGIEDIINNPQNIVAIEWAEKIKSLLPKKRWDVKFEDLGGNTRKIIVNQKL